MKIKNIYASFLDDLKTRDKNYHKAAIICYFAVLVFLIINLVVHFLLKIDNSLFQTIWLIVTVVNDYFFNSAITLFCLINMILQIKIAHNVHSLLSIFCFGILLCATIILIILF